MRTATTSLLIFAALVAFGCKSTGFLAKREAEKCCPTDIRKTVPWCAGEDALFQGPCQPDASFYGYKPTCWGTWPASGSDWRDLHCGETHHGAVITELMKQNHELIELPSLESPPEAIQQETTGKHESILVDAAPEAEQQPQAELEEEREPETSREVEAAAESREALPSPIFGPIRLPPIDAE